MKKPFVAFIKVVGDKKYCTHSKLRSNFDFTDYRSENFAGERARLHAA